jgi:hypothetical protein
MQKRETAIWNTLMASENIKLDLQLKEDVYGTSSGSC